MRMAFGLVSLLVVIGIIYWVFSGLGTGTGGVAENLSAARQAEERVQAFSGRTEDGGSLAETFELITAGGSASRPHVVVETAEANAPFGLRQGDRILSGNAAAGFVQDVGEFGAATANEVEALVVTAARIPDGVLTVERDGRRLTLNVSGAIIAGNETAEAGPPGGVQPSDSTTASGAPEQPPAGDEPAGQPPRNPREMIQGLQDRIGR